MKFLKKLEGDLGFNLQNEKKLKAEIQIEPFGTIPRSPTYSTLILSEIFSKQSNRGLKIFRINKNQGEFAAQSHLFEVFETIGKRNLGLKLFFVKKLNYYHA